MPCERGDRYRSLGLIAGRASCPCFPPLHWRDASATQRLHRRDANHRVSGSRSTEREALAGLEAGFGLAGGSAGSEGPKTRWS